MKQNNKKNKDFNEKLFDFIFKTCRRVAKKSFKNIKNVPTLFKTKEKYLLIINLIATSIVIIYKDLYLSYISFMLVFNYFILKAICQELKETAISKKYKRISELFHYKVRVINVKNIGNDKSIYTLHSYVSERKINLQIKEIEHFLNREIIEVKRNERNFRKIEITVNNNKNKKKYGKYKAKYKLADYINDIPIKNQKLPVVFGMNKDSKYIIKDLIDLNHTFISGETGSGKSNLLNCILLSLMYYRNNISYIFVDFKLVELGIYKDFNNCYCVKDSDDFVEKLIWLKKEMNNRYQKFLDNNVKSINSYNKKTGKNIPYIVMVIDEISNIRLSAKTNKSNSVDIENTLIELLNMARASGILLICCTQNPHGLEMKANVRSKFVTNVSGRIERPEIQEKTCVLGTENLKKGEFKFNSPGENGTEFKSFFVDDNDLIFRKLEKIYKGGDDIDIIFKQDNDTENKH